MIWFILLVLGILIYFFYLIVERSVARITTTPVWMLWLAATLPAFVWAGWIVTQGDTGIPLLLLTVSIVISSVLYWFLVQRGRVTQPTTTESQPKQDVINAVTERQTALRPINKEEEADLQNCFPWSVFYLQNIEHRPQALICRGQLRTSPEVAYNTIRDNIEVHFSDRFLVVFQEGLNGKPFFVLVPNPQSRAVNASRAERSTFRPGLAIGLFLATLLTTTLAGAMLLTGNSLPDLLQDMPIVLTGLPYALALMAVLGTHELGHFLAACYYRVRATLPYFFPVPPLGVFPFGTFGAFIQLRSPLPNRKALFDVGIAGPLAGFIVTVPVLFWGLANSEVVAFTEQSSILNFDSFNPTASLLIALLSKLALGSAIAAGQAIKLHPVAIAGCLGLIITALNLMPVGQLDGGHIVHAMFGQRTGALIGQVARLLVLALSFVQRELLLWAVLLFFMPVVDEPALNDVTELDNGRDFLGLLALGVLVAIILPAPQALTQAFF
jgi:membrane-associated protease RseP (regulator of RpoE activity)